MNKKSKKLIILMALLIITLTLGVGGYTYAKYKTSVKGGGKVDIAKWSFFVNGEKEQIEEIKLIDTIDESLLQEGKIAPGTRGEFTIDIDGRNSEVGIDYEIRFINEQNKPTNLIFYYEEQPYKTLSEIGVIMGKINLNEENKVKAHSIKWEWKYETGKEEEIEKNDLIDTEEGNKNFDYTFNVSVIGTQVPFIEY